MLQRWLATPVRADDLRRTLAGFDASGPAAVVPTFHKLSKQCELLLYVSQVERCDEPAAAALHSRHFAVPSAVSGMGSVAGVPHLLSTRLDKEHEDQVARRAMLTSPHKEACRDSDLETHNKTVVAAHAHLATSAESLDLPGAAALRSGRGGGGDAAAASAYAVNAAPTPAGTPATVSQTQGNLLVGALRTGAVLELPPPPVGKDDMD